MKQEELYGYLFIAVPLAILVIFSFVPMGYAFIASFYRLPLLGFDRIFVGLENYSRLFNDPVFNIALRNTFIYTAIVVPAQTFLALFLAILANRAIRGQSFFRTSYYTPAVVSSVAISLIFVWLYRSDGLINYLFSFLRINGPDWLNDPRFALPAIMMLNIWTTSGYFMVTYLAGIQSIPHTVYEAAEIDGAGSWSRFWKITLPLLAPSTIFVVLLSTIGCLQIFDQVYVMTEGGPYPYATTTINYLIWSEFSFGNLGYACAIAMILFIMIMLITYVQIRFSNREVGY